MTDEWDGPACVLPAAPPWHRPGEFAGQTVVTASVAAWSAQTRCSLDRLLWEQAAEALDKTSRSGKLHPGMAARLAHAIRAGLNGVLPPSWVPHELSASLPTLSLADWPREARAIAYELACRRGYLTDAEPRRTAMSKHNIELRQWQRWENTHRGAAERILELLALDVIHLLGTPAAESYLRWRLLG
jgi:hypothetical protein